MDWEREGGLGKARAAVFTVPDKSLQLGQCSVSVTAAEHSPSVSSPPGSPRTQSCSPHPAARWQSCLLELFFASSHCTLGSQLDLSPAWMNEPMTELGIIVFPLALC